MSARAPRPRRPSARSTGAVFVRCPYVLSDYFGIIVSSIAETLDLHGRRVVLNAGEASLGLISDISKAHKAGLAAQVAQLKEIQQGSAYKAGAAFQQAAREVFNLTPEQERERVRVNTRLSARIKNANVLIIDEISMLTGATLKAAETVSRNFCAFSMRAMVTASTR